MFLLAAYSRYNGPYVWIRSNHERIIHFSDEGKSEKDYPLQLKSTTSWHQESMITENCHQSSNLQHFIACLSFSSKWSQLQTSLLN